MDRTPIHDPSMTPSPNTIPGNLTTNQSSQVSSKTMIYVCGECHKDNELKSTDVIRCKKNKIQFFYFIKLYVCFFSS